MKGKLIDWVAQYEQDVERITKFENVARYSFSTPSHDFENYVFEKGDRIVKITCYRKTEASSIDAIIDYLEKHDIPRSDFAVVDVNIPSQFDGLAFVGASGHTAYKAFDPKLHSVTVECFPVFKSEFSGAENADEVFRKRFHEVDTLDFSRIPNSDN